MSEIKIGARVTLAGTVISDDHSSTGDYGIKVDNDRRLPGLRFYPPGAFLTVENPPEPLKVGCQVELIGGLDWPYKVIGVDDDEIWLKGDSGRRYTYRRDQIKP